MSVVACYKCPFKRECEEHVELFVHPGGESMPSTVNAEKCPMVPTIRDALQKLAGK